MLDGIHKRIHKIVVDGLRVTINDHGSITRNEIGSAAKRVSSRICAQIKQAHPEDAPEGPSKELGRAGTLYVSALKSLVDGYRNYKGWERIEAIRDSVNVQEQRWKKALNREVRDQGDK